MTPSNHNRMMFATFSQTPGSCKHRSSSRWPTIPLLISDKGSRASASRLCTPRAIPIVRHGAGRTGPARSPRRQGTRATRGG